MPDIDSSLLVLMGISQGGYLGKKLVTFGTRTLYTPDPARPRPAPRSRCPVPISERRPAVDERHADCHHGWSAASIGFSVPAVNPAGDATSTAPEPVVQLVASVIGQSSNPVNFSVTP